MFQRLIATLSRWIGAEAEQATYTAIRNGARRGAERALLELTAGSLSPAELFQTDTIEATQTGHLEAPQTATGSTGGFIGPEPPALTRTQINALRRDDLIELAQARGLNIDTAGNVRDIRAAVLDELGI